MRDSTNSPSKLANQIERKNEIRVGVADLATSTDGKTLVTSSLGSCVAIGIYEDSGIAGLLHAMLPKSPTDPEQVGKYVDSGIRALKAEITRRSNSQPTLTAKIAGGSNMLDITNSKPINDRNVDMARRTLSAHGIDLEAGDTGGDSPRSVSFNPQTGIMEVRQGTTVRHL